MNTYLSWFDWSRTTTGLEWQSLIGCSGRINATTVGATTLTVTPPLAVSLRQYDVLTIYDGSSSENVTVQTVAGAGTSSITISATQYAHVAGTSYSTDGVLGSLADQIIKASQELETICRQSLFLSTYTNEMLALPTMRAAIDNQFALHFRPRHWPVQTLTALSITTVPGNTISYDPTQVIIDSDKQICSMPNMQPLPLPGSGQSPYPIWNVPSRYRQAQVTITYTAGFSVMPADVTEAAVLLVSDLLAKRLNPVGAADITSGDRRIATVLRGDFSGESLLRKKAQAILNSYTMQSF